MGHGRWEKAIYNVKRRREVRLCTVRMEVRYEIYEIHETTNTVRGDGWMDGRIRVCRNVSYLFHGRMEGRIARIEDGTLLKEGDPPLVLQGRGFRAATVAGVDAELTIPVLDPQDLREDVVILVIEMTGTMGSIGIGRIRCVTGGCMRGNRWISGGKDERGETGTS